MIAGTSRGSDRTSTMSADSIATSVPAPMAIPTSADTSAGASFTPSPTIATVKPRRFTSAIFAAFWSGSTSAKYSVMPSSVATHRATVVASPVSMIGVTPIALSRRKASRDSGRMMSANPMAPIALPAAST